MDNEPHIMLHQLERSGSGIKLGRWGDKDVDNDGSFHPHRHDHYTCMLLEHGEVDVLLDFENFKMSARTLFISYPGQVHQVLSSKNGNGWYLSFDDALIDNTVRNSLNSSLAEKISVTLGHREFKWFINLINSMRDLGEINDFPPHEVEHLLLSAFVSQAILSYQRRQLTEQINIVSRPFLITRRFKNLVRCNFRSIKKPGAYADLLNITVSYLNDTVKSVTGLSVTSTIQIEIIKEAQRLLNYTEMTVKEIATSLGYDDQKYFTRLFGKITGLSPGIYRSRSVNGKRV